MMKATIVFAVLLSVIFCSRGYSQTNEVFKYISTCLPGKKSIADSSFYFYNNALQNRSDSLNINKTRLSPSRICGFSENTRRLFNHTAHSRIFDKCIQHSFCSYNLVYPFVNAGFSIRSMASDSVVQLDEFTFYGEKTALVAAKQLERKQFIVTEAPAERFFMIRNRNKIFLITMHRASSTMDKNRQLLVALLQNIYLMHGGSK